MSTPAMERAADDVYMALKYALEDGDEPPTTQTAQSWSEHLRMIPYDVVADHLYAKGQKT